MNSFVPFYIRDLIPRILVSVGTTIVKLWGNLKSEFPLCKVDWQGQGWNPQLCSHCHHGADTLEPGKG